jgi:uncharacterized protein (TIGR02284 family)
METLDRSIEVLNDLIAINNDRIAGFAHAMQELGDHDDELKALFKHFKDESLHNVHELGTAINKNHGEVEMGMTQHAALHRLWLDIRSAFSGHASKSILEECERGEDAIKKVYQNALTHQGDLPSEFIAIITRQEQEIISAHNQIKALRDIEE